MSMDDLKQAPKATDSTLAGKYQPSQKGFPFYEEHGLTSEQGFRFEQFYQHAPGMLATSNLIGEYSHAL